MATYLPDMMIGEEGGVGGGEVLEDIFLDTPIEGAPLTAGNSSFINDVIKDVQLIMRDGKQENQTNAVHMNVQRGSYFEMTLPWTVSDDGYVTKINGQFLHVDASSSLNMRGDAMFSAEERSLDEETLEYAWLVELTVGTLSGKLTTPQLQNIITALEAFVFTVEDAENSLRHPRPYLYCYHGTPQPQCPQTTSEHFCPTTDTIKYKMVRASLDEISLNLVESGTILCFQQTVGVKALECLAALVTLPVSVILPYRNEVSFFTAEEV
ncbi:hypothetical protein Pmani_036385 [Petrolisthes manimaculis]|uniref:Uncharacterized protein n=1 Tax=Petrolisthes manimaculis TaxID=1843537 RepID=A0AAE1NJF5_9EUCA|nr:hypothetical protein Pmani_036385 [Petrolisthes manimaculis]